MNNPIVFFDPDGGSALRYIVKGLAGSYRFVKRSVAVRVAGKRPRSATVVGPGSSKKARGIAKELRGGKVIRHDGHKLYENSDKVGLPHHQPKKNVGGQVHYTGSNLMLAAAAGAGAFTASEVEAATGSRLIGKATSFVVDFLNPAGDTQEIESLLEKIGTDLIELVYDVDLEEADQVLYHFYVPIDTDVE